MKNRNTLALATLAVLALSAHADEPPMNGACIESCAASVQTIGDTTDTVDASNSYSKQLNPSSASNASGVDIGADQRLQQSGNTVDQSGSAQTSWSGSEASGNSLDNRNDNWSSVGNTSASSGGNTLSNGSSSSSGATSSSGGNTMVGGAVSTSTSVNVGGDTVTYEAQKRDPVASAWAAPLTSANGTCMGSTSAGAQGVTIGVSFGTTWTDSGCDARYDAIALQQIGERAAARARLCLKPEIAEAFKRAGHPCKDGGQAAAHAEPGTPVAVANVYMN